MFNLPRLSEIESSNSPVTFDFIMEILLTSKTSL